MPVAELVATCVEHVFSVNSATVMPLATPPPLTAIVGVVLLPGEEAGVLSASVVGADGATVSSTY